MTWPTVQMEDIAEKIAMGPFGSNIKVETFVDKGIPIISGQHLHGTRLDENPGFNFITEEHADRLANSCVNKGDIVFTHAGTIGQVSLIPDNAQYEKYVISQRQFYLRPSKDEVDPAYLTRWFHGPVGRHRLLMHASQVGVPSISRPASNLKQIEIELPPLSVQKEITGVLDALEDKIELNRKTAATLEDMARALYKSWFVDFDPVVAKSEGRQPAFMDAETAALFPDSFGDDGLPEGWAQNPIGSFLTLNYGKALKKDKRIPGQYPVYGSGGTDSTHTEALVVEPTIVVGRKGTVGSLHWEPKGCWPIDTTFFVTSELPMSFIFRMLQSLPLSEMNTDAAVPGLNRDNAYRLEVPMPSDAIVSAFDQKADYMQNYIDHLSDENQTLAELRDTLLPKLMSGELRVGEARVQVEQVA